MSGCDFEAIEALIHGELDAAAEEARRAHLATCAACAEELRLLREERALFAERAAHQPPPPSFAAVLARERWSREPAPPPRAAPARVLVKPPSRAPRLPWAALGVAAAAALALVFVPRDHAPLPPPEGEVEIHAEPAACFDDEARASVTPATPWTAGAPAEDPPCAEHEPACSNHCEDEEEAHECGEGSCSAVTNGCFRSSDEEGDHHP